MNFEAVIPDPVRILGVRLLPLSLGRYRMLSRFRCAFVADGPATGNVDDLFAGIFICGMRCREFLGLVESGRVARELKRWGKRIRKEIRADGHFSLVEKFALFKEFVQTAARVPPYWQEREDSGSTTAHWSQMVEVTLRADLGWSLEEIEEEPLSKAIADYFRWAEAQGLVRLIGEQELAEAENNARIWKEALRQAEIANRSGPDGPKERRETVEP